MRHARPSQDSDLVPCTETYSAPEPTKLLEVSFPKINPACAPPLHARGAGSPSPGDLAATGAQVPTAPVALCCDCRAPMSALEVRYYKFMCRVCVGSAQ
jgi:hypothetical protein